MKTITEYQPMIFSRLLEVTQERIWRRRQLRIETIGALTYLAVGLWLAFDTGFVAWDWQFWVMFGPLVIAGELTMREMTRQ